ncbi:MAG: class I mannose-6-phosphate isomerase [Bacteroidales bacterium]|nr:class I mannose-6-phosphate isomerase [Bacteroidales bacterium]
MESLLYPLKFKPLFKDKIWGGDKIQTRLGINYGELPNCGEMWSLSGVEDNETVVENGFLAENNLNEVLEIYMGDLIGERNYERFGNEFPILIKVIDANDKLSIQVHPDDKLAQERGLGNGKTEMWYVMDADNDAEIIDGFSKDITPEYYQKALEVGKLTSCMNIEKPQNGDVFFIPAGRVHALGKGLLIAEIQQTSDTTYRIYDYDRTDSNGNTRELHTQEALAAIDFSATKEPKTNYEYKKNTTVELANCPYFTTNMIALDNPLKKDFTDLDSFVIYFCVEGICAVRTLDTIVPIRAGECVLVPAVATTVEIFPEKDAKVLEIYIETPENMEYQSKIHDNDIFVSFDVEATE